MGYLCVPAPSLAEVKEQAGGRLRSRERQVLQGEERGDSHRSLWYCPIPSGAHCLSLRPPWSLSSAASLSQRQRVPGEPAWPSGRRKGHTLLLEALALHSSPLSTTKAWSPWALPAWPSTPPSTSMGACLCPTAGPSTECLGVPSLHEHVPPYSGADAPLFHVGLAMPPPSQQLGLPSQPRELLRQSLPLLLASSRDGGCLAPEGPCLPPERTWGWFAGVFSCAQLGFSPPFPHPPLLLHTPLPLGYFAWGGWAPVPTYSHFSMLLRSPHLLLG